MTSISTQNQRNNGGLLLLLLFAAVIVALAVAVGQLELTPHAQSGRVETSLDAATISSMIQNNMCKRVESYECPELRQQKVLCKVKGDIWAGLIIGKGTNPPVIVTGYPATYKYWMGTMVRDRCYKTINQ